MQNYPTRIKRLLRETMAEAYERELRRELAQLDQSFAEWRQGTISSGGLSDQEQGELQSQFIARPSPGAGYRTPGTRLRGG